MCFFKKGEWASQMSWSAHKQFGFNKEGHIKDIWLDSYTRCSLVVLRGYTTKKVSYVDESDLGGLLAEATSAEHEIVLSDQTTAVTAGTAREWDVLTKLLTRSESRDHTHEDERNP